MYRVGLKLTITFKDESPKFYRANVLANIKSSSFKGIKNDNLRWIDCDHLPIFRYTSDKLIYNFYLSITNINLNNLRLQTKNIIQESINKTIQLLNFALNAPISDIIESKVKFESINLPINIIDSLEVDFMIERSIVSYRLDE